METAEILKKVRKIEIKTRGLCSQLFAGEYHSAFKGHGMSFSENREYQPGDETRLIDWNVTARFNHTYIKVFEEDRELNVVLMIDASGSSAFGAYRQLKSELMTEISALLAYSAISNNDKVAAIFFTDRIEKFIPAKKGRSHILRIIRELVDFRPTSTQTNLSRSFHFLNNVMKKRSVVFVLSDFMAQHYNHMLRIAAKKHDVIGLHIYDQRERYLPDVGLLNTMDAETGKQVYINTSSSEVRTVYAKQFHDNYYYFKLSFLKSGADNISISTTDNYIKSLMLLFERRAKRL